MTTLTDLTIAQIARAYGALAGISTTPKSFNTRAKGLARLETLMANEGLTLAEVLVAAGLAAVDDALEQDVVVAEASFATKGDTAETPDPSEALTSNKVVNDVRDLLVRYFINVTGLDDQSAVYAALRAVKALPPPLPAAPPLPHSREGTKQALMIAMLRQPEGATISKLASTLGWATHSVRGMISGGLKKKLGLNVVSEKMIDGARTYRIAPDAE